MAAVKTNLDLTAHSFVHAAHTHNKIFILFNNSVVPCIFLLFLLRERIACSGLDYDWPGERDQRKIISFIIYI